MSKKPHIGRKKGVPNKKTQDLFAKCEEAGVDPFMGLLLLARDGEKEETRLQAHSTLCKYLYPQRKAVEMTGQDGKELGFQIVVKDYISK